MNQEKIIQAIADVINKKGTDDFGMLPWCKPSDLIAELAAAIAPHLEEPDFPLSKLFDHMSNEHGLTLLDTELGDIIHIARCK